MCGESLADSETDFKSRWLSQVFACVQQQRFVYAIGWFGLWALGFTRGPGAREKATQFLFPIP